MSTNGVKILGLHAENVLRLKTVLLALENEDGEVEAGVVEVAGDNAQGKTSVFKAAMIALGGARLQDPVLIRRGEEEAVAEVRLDNGLVVRRSFKVGEEDKLEVWDADGVKVRRKPQDLLNDLVGKGGLAFDPLEFVDRMDPAKQAETIKRVAGLDLTGLEEEYRRLYDERTAAGRKLKEAEAKLSGHAVIPSGTPDEEVNLANLAGRQKELVQEVAANAAKRLEAKSVVRALTAMQGEQVRRLRRVEELRAQLAAAQKEWEDGEVAVSVAEDRALVLEENAAALIDPDTSAVEAEMAAAEETNRQVRLKLRRKELAQELNAAGEAHAALERAVAENRERRRQQIAAAPLPLPELGLDDEGMVTWDGLPLRQASRAQQVRISVAVGLALHPKLRVMFVKDAATLDKKSRRELLRIAKEQDAQIWTEVIDPTAQTMVIIENGEARGPAADAAIAATKGEEADR